jgi:hypothetical protein
MVIPSKKTNFEATMSKLVSGTAIAAAIFASVTTASAFEFTGSSIGVEYSRFNAKGLDEDDNPTRLERVSLTGSASFNITPTFGMQVDTGSHELGLSDMNVKNFGLHGYYNLSDTSAVGAFITHESADDDSLNLVGLEYNRAFDLFEFDVYAAQADDDDETAKLLGTSGRYAMGERFGLLFDLSHLKIDTLEMTNLSLGTDFQISDISTVYLNSGTASLDTDEGSSNEGFIAVGAKFSFGPNNGSTFNNRSIFGTFPGF